MNILLVSQHDKIKGGSDVVVHQTKRILESNGHKVFLYTARSDVEGTDKTLPSADHFYKPRLTNITKSLYSFDAKNKLTRFIKNKKIDLAHLHIYYGTLTSSILSVLKKNSIPIIQHVHEYRTFCSVYTASRDGKNCHKCSVGYYLPGLIHKCNRNSFMRSLVMTTEMYFSDFLGAKKLIKKFIAVSEFQRTTLIKQGISPKKIITVYNPVLNYFTESYEKIECNSKKFDVIYVGRIEEYKGIWQFVKLAEAKPDWSFVILGSGSLEVDLSQHIKDRMLNNVEYIGAVEKEEVCRYLKNSKIIFVPSMWDETFGLTVAEAQALGLPAVVYDSGGMPEVIEDRKTGFVVKKGDLTNVIDSIGSIINDDTRYNKVSRLAYERVLNEFSEDRYYKDLKSVYQSIL